MSNIVEQAAARDVQEVCVYDGCVLPKLYAKMQYCVPCRTHSHVVRVRSRTDRRKRDPSPHFNAGKIYAKTWSSTTSCCMSWSSSPSSSLKANLVVVLSAFKLGC